MNALHPRIVPILSFICLFASTAVAAPHQPNETERRHFGGVMPRVSPDGESIAVSYQGSICRLDLSDDILRQLTTDQPGWDVNPAWSPDGKRIAYINAPNFSVGALRVIDAATGDQIKLPANIRAQGEMFFHPDGDRLLGRFSASGYPHYLAWLDINSGEVTVIPGIGPKDPTELARKRMHYALSADGETIYFALNMDRPNEQGGNRGPQMDLFRITANGGKAGKITRFPARIHNLAADGTGSGVHVVTDLGGAHYDVWHVPLKNALRDMQRITHGVADEDWPSVSRHETVLVHTENSLGATALVRRNLSTGSEQKLRVYGVGWKGGASPTRILVSDKTSGKPTTARVSIQRKGGKFHAPFGALYRLTNGRGHFYCEGESTIYLPAGEYRVTALRGPEYRVFEKDITLKRGQREPIRIELERWTDMAAKGWFSGENHTHANYGYGAWYNFPETIARQVNGEDLNVCNAVVANSDGDGVFDREFFRGGLDPKSTKRHLIYWNEELRSTIWGHLTLQNLQQLVEPIFLGFKDTTNPYDIPTLADVEQEAIDQGGAVSYTHPASNPQDLYDRAYTAKGLPVDAALGRVHTMDVMCGGYEASKELWYKLLNCGLRVHAAAGTDCFLNRIPSLPPGWGRAYVRLPDGLSYQGWIDGQKAGRSFVSNGPVIEFAADGKLSGSTIKLTKPGGIKIRVVVESQFPLNKVEIIQNGKVIRTEPSARASNKVAFNAEVDFKTSGWVAVRASGPNHPLVIRRNPVAHTNPVYVEIADKPQDAKADAEYFLKWIDRLEGDLRKRDRMHTGQKHIEAQLKQARAVYRALLEE